MTNIRVALRVRPLSHRELEGNYPIVVSVENNSAFITDIRVPERPSADSRQRFRQFDFDHSFWFSNNVPGNAPQASASQDEVYREMGPHLEKAILAGYNACLLAYGQSGSGKTHTMIGTREEPGIIPRLCQSLWDKLHATYPPLPCGKTRFRMEVSFLEIYREKVRDLLNPEKSLKLREHPQVGPHVQGLTRLEVTGEMSLLDLLWEGERRRATGNTSSNRRSSRSHAIWTLYLTVHTGDDGDGNGKASTSSKGCKVGRNYGDRSSSSGDNAEESNSNASSARSSAERRNSPGKDGVITNQVHLVDLAGSEKADCTTAKSLLAEGADINRSLVALGNVISALAERAQYVPYRDSALTWLLKDSIGGNASTSIIITASPSSHCHAQTLNSLRFAQRARLVQNTPKINLAPASSNLYGPYGFLSVMSAMELKKDISRLAKIIKTAQTLIFQATHFVFGRIKFDEQEQEEQRFLYAIAMGEFNLLFRSQISSMLLDYPGLEQWRIRNGGILRGFAPRGGLTRLIHAIEGIGQAEKEQLRLQRERACSEDTTATSSSSKGKCTSGSNSTLNDPGSSSSSATLTQAKSLNDVMVQADVEKRSALHNLRRRKSRQSESCLDRTSSASKIVGTEVFIPTSNSYKCLTWQQEETHPVPKPITSSNDSSLVSLDDIEEGPGPVDPQIQHLKYLLEVHYPVTHNLDHASRISERIHGNLTDEYYQRKAELYPTLVEEDMEPPVPLVHNTIPTLVNPRTLSELIQEEEVEEVEDDLARKLLYQNTVLVGHRAKEEKEYLFPTKCKHFASPFTALEISPFVSSDEHEFNEPENIEMHTNCRAVHSEVTKRSQRTLMDDNTYEDTCYFTAGESILSQLPNMVISTSSSSYESINMPETVRPVNMIREFSKFSDEFEEDHIDEFEIENEVFHDEFEPPVANICMVPGHPMDTAVPIEILVAEPLNNDPPMFNPINGVSDSKFRNYFAKELHQMERMGKQIKTLLQMTQRYNVVKPYLDEISNLQNSDHSKPDPKLDAHIDSCSGWNVDIELAKVHQEIHSLNKVLKTGLGPSGMAGNSNSHSQQKVKIPQGGKHPPSSTSTINQDHGLTSDSSADVDGYYSGFAQTRHIPLLSGKSSSSGVSVPKNDFKKRNPHPPHPPAKGSKSQPILSTSSSNNDTGSFHNFTPNFHHSTPANKTQYQQRKYPGGGNTTGGSDIEEEQLYGLRHQPPPLISTFRPHPAPPSLNSLHTFYRNAALANTTGSNSFNNNIGLLQYCPSNSNMSSISSNASQSISMNYDSLNSYSHLDTSGYPLNISSSERKFNPSAFAGQGQGQKGLNLRTSESSTNFHSYTSRQNSFNPEEIRSHRQMYEGVNGTSGGGGKDLNLKYGSSEFSSGYSFSHQRNGSDSLDLCSCGDSNSNSKYSMDQGTAPFSSLEKSSSRSQYSAFGGSTTTEGSDYLSRHSHHHHHPSSYMNHNHTSNSHGHVSGLPPPYPHPHGVVVKTARINRNDNF